MRIRFVSGLQKRRRDQKGITLVELLVALVIVALAASVAVLSAPPPRGPARAEADRFAARLAAASEDSLLAGAPMRLEVASGGYFFSTFSKGEWSPVLDPPALRRRRLVRGVAMSIDIADPALKNEQADSGMDDEPLRVMFDPTGFGEAFTARFVDRRESWVVKFDAGGKLTVAKDAAQTQ